MAVDLELPVDTRVTAGLHPHGVTNADLDAIHQRRAEGALTSEVRGEMAFAQCLGAAPSIAAAMQRLKDDGRA